MILGILVNRLAVALIILLCHFGAECLTFEEVECEYVILPTQQDGQEDPYQEEPIFTVYPRKKQETSVGWFGVFPALRIPIVDLKDLQLGSFILGVDQSHVVFPLGFHVLSYANRFVEPADVQFSSDSLVALSVGLDMSESIGYRMERFALESLEAPGREEDTCSSDSLLWKRDGIVSDDFGCHDNAHIILNSLNQPFSPLEIVAGTILEVCHYFSFSKYPKDLIATRLLLHL